MSNYLNFSRSPYYAVVTALPLLVVYELLLALDGGYVQGQVRNAADVWLRILLSSLGLSPFHATLFMILAVILAIPLLRDKSTPINGRYLGLMAIEAVVYGILLGFAINTILGFIFFYLPSMLGTLSESADLLPPASVLARDGALPALAIPREGGFLQGMALSLGAGLFEELFFRVILLNLMLYLTRLLLTEWAAVFVSILGAAFLFSLAHYIGPLGEPLRMDSFLFRWIAGLIFTVLYFVRGFAVTAYSHAFYDIWVITGLFRLVG